MSKRVLFLLLFAASILLLRGLHFYEELAKERIQEGEIGVATEVRNGHLYVKAIAEKSFAGSPTLSLLSGLKPGDEIVSVQNRSGEGKEITSFFAMGEVLKTIRADEEWSINILRNGSSLTLKVPPAYRPAGNFRYWLLRTMFVFAMPLLILIVAFFLGFANPADDNAFLASIFFASFSFVFGLPFHHFPPFIREFSLLLGVTCISFSGYLFARFFLTFPTRSLLDRKWPWIRKVIFTLAFVFWFINIIASFSFYTSFRLYERLTGAIRTINPFFESVQIIIVSVGLISLVLHFVKAETKDEKRKTGILLAGALIGIVPLVIFLRFYSYSSGTPAFWAVVCLIISIGLFPLSFLYVVLRHRVLGIRLIIRRGLQYALVSRGFFVIEGIVLFALIYLALSALRVLNYTEVGLVGISLVAAAAFGVAAGLRQINQKAMSAIDRRFFRNAYNSQRVLTELARGVRRLAAQPDKLFDLTTDQLSDALLPDQVGVFLREDTSYRCNGLRVRSNYDDEVWFGTTEHRKLCFAANSLIGRELDRFKSEDPECLEVVLNDPKSWAHSLMRADLAESHFQEKALLEKMNTKLIVPLASGDQVLGFLSLGDKLSEEAYSKQDRELLLSVGEQVAIALEYSKMITQVAEQEKMKRELQIATEVQARLFPQSLPPMQTFEYTGYCKAALSVGGDYYDFLLLDEKTLGVALGDVSGKGISSALLMANLQALLRSGAFLRREQIDLLMNDINRLLCLSTTTHKYATFFYCIYEDHSRKLTYVNAGHNPPMLFRSGGAMERLTTGGLVVGMLPDVVYKKDVVQLQSGDILMIYSDGLSEAMNLAEEEFGEQRIIQEICSNRSLPVEQLRDRILSQVSTFVGDAPQHDDLTLVIARVV